MEKITTLQKNTGKFSNSALIKAEIEKLESAIAGLEIEKAEGIKGFHDHHEKLTKGLSMATMLPKRIIELEDALKYNQRFRDVCDTLLGQRRGQLSEAIMFLRQSEAFVKHLRQEISDRELVIKIAQQDLAGLNGKITDHDRNLAQERIRDCSAEILMIQELLLKFES